MGKTGSNWLFFRTSLFLRTHCYIVEPVLFFVQKRKQQPNISSAAMLSSINPLLHGRSVSFNVTIRPDIALVLCFLFASLLVRYLMRLVCKRVCKSRSTPSPGDLESPDTPNRLLRKAETVLARRTDRVILVLERPVVLSNVAANFRTMDCLGVQTIYMVESHDPRKLGPTGSHFLLCYFYFSLNRLKFCDSQNGFVVIIMWYSEYDPF